MADAIHGAMTAPVPVGRERGMIFSVPMVRALLAGRKSQTRWALKPQPAEDIGLALAERPLPYRVGDRIWVRETWQLHARASDVCTVVYRASANASWTEAHEQFPNMLAGKMQPRPFQAGWASSVRMPRWASRLSLTITDVRVERLQSISEADALAEGIDRLQFPERGDWGWPQARYRDLWNSIHGPDAWSANPWVAALTFVVEPRNIDAVAP